MNYEKLWKSLKQFSGDRIVLPMSHIGENSTIVGMMSALEVMDAQQNTKEAEKTANNNRMLKCRFHNKGRGCPIGKVPCPEGHGCMLQIVTSAY